MKNHVKVGGKLLQTNKTYNQLKQKQKDKIAQWMYEETHAYFEEHGKFLAAKNEHIIIDAAYHEIMKGIMK